MRKFIHPGQSLGLPLAADERTLLADGLPAIDPAYVSRIRNTPANRSAVPFTLDELDDLAGYVAAEANHCKSKRKQKALDAVYATIQHLLASHTDEREAGKPDALGELAAAGIDPKRFGPLRLFMAEMRAMGLDGNAALERLRPKTVAPDEKLPVRMGVSAKELVLGLAGLGEDIRKEIAQTPPTKRTVALTLRQVTALELLVAAAAGDCADQKRARRWRDIDRNLTDVQVHHSDGMEQGLEQALQGQPGSKGAVVRHVLLRVLEERKQAGAGKSPTDLCTP